MGIYITPPTESKLEWLQVVGKQFSDPVLTPEDYLHPFANRLVFWSPAAWGDNAALGYTKAEIVRLFYSGVFEKLYVVPVKDLENIGALGVNA